MLHSRARAGPEASGDSFLASYESAQLSPSACGCEEAGSQHDTARRGSSRRESPGDITPVTDQVLLKSGAMMFAPDTAIDRDP